MCSVWRSNAWGLTWRVQDILKLVWKVFFGWVAAHDWSILQLAMWGGISILADSVHSHLIHNFLSFLKSLLVFIFEIQFFKSNVSLWTIFFWQIKINIVPEAQIMLIKELVLLFWQLPFDHFFRRNINLWKFWIVFIVLSTVMVCVLKLLNYRFISFHSFHMKIRISLRNSFNYRLFLFFWTKSWIKTCLRHQISQFDLLRKIMFGFNLLFLALFLLHFFLPHSYFFGVSQILLKLPLNLFNFLL